jgi:hypothetical protein
LFSASGIFGGGRYQPGYTEIFCTILKAYGSYAFVEQNFRFSFKKSKFKCPHPTTSSWELVS